MQLVTTNRDGQPVTTTLAIAEGTGNEHRAVLQLVRKYLADFEGFGGVAFQMRPFETAGGTQQREVAILNEHQATLLLTYMRNSDVVREFKKTLVGEFYRMANELRQQPVATTPAQPLLPSTQAKHIVADTLDIANLLRVPLHIGQQEAVKTARNQTGFDFAPLLAFAPAQTDVPATEVMLEPTELAQRLGVKGARSMNAILRDNGLQVKVNGEWQPTARGENLCVRHAWVSGNKSGYNLKWRLSPIRKALAPKLVDQSA